jgi:hypothetical protein
MTAYGYTGVGICRRCSMPSHLFVSSESDLNGYEFCQYCYGYYTNDTIGNVPIMDETPKCGACCRPEFISDVVADSHPKWEFITAYLADTQTEIVVHRDCSSLSNRTVKCEHCDIVYATTRHSNWRNENVTDNFSVIVQIEGDYRCSNCAQHFYQENGGMHNYNSCSSCEDIVHRDNGRFYNDYHYCHGCYDNSYYECDNCGASAWDGDGHECSDEDEDESSSAIHSYSYRPSPYFFGIGQYHLGFELEVESRRNSRYEGAELAQSELGGHAYMKDDGSLNDGFEVVTHPHTLSDYQTAFNWDFVSKLKDKGFRSWNTETCGLHVHVSRTAFGKGVNPWGREDREALILNKQSHELRFMKLIYDNQRQVERIAGRSNNSYATFGDKGMLVRKLKSGYQSDGRYSAINTQNDATLEVRVFKGSLRKERVLSALEFVAASVEYTRDLKVTSKNQALSWLRFTAYVSDNMETYPNLALIMSESFASDATPFEN